MHTYSGLALAFLFIGFIGLHAGIGDLQKANRMAAWPLLVGIFGIPLNLVAAESWAAGHQAALAGIMGASDISTSELLSLLAMGLGFLMYACIAALLRLDCVILEEEFQGNWATPPGSAAP